MSSFYDENGDVQYELPNKSKPGEMRSVTIKDARKYGWVPRTTSITGFPGKPGLISWRGEQLFKAVREILGEVDADVINGLWDVKVEADPLVYSGYNTSDTLGLVRDYFDSREKTIYARWRKLMSEAADFGSAGHAVLEHCAHDMTIFYSDGASDRLKRCTNPAIEWLDEHVDVIRDDGRGETRFCPHFHMQGTEIAFCHNGYGGTVDLVVFMDGEWWVIDYKFTSPTVSKTGKVSLSGYPEHKWQLAAYQQAMEARFGLPMRTGNLLISSDPENPMVKFVDQTDKMDEGWDAFHAVLKCWMVLNKHTPPSYKGE